MTAAAESRTLAGMILCAEYGLHFQKDGDWWRCVEQPDVMMWPGPERYVRESGTSAHSMTR